MNVFITGAGGFIAKNLRLHLSKLDSINVDCFTRNNTIDELYKGIKKADFIFHLAGVNRVENSCDFKKENLNLTKKICDAVEQSGKYIPIVYSSSTQAALENAYGISKREAENALLNFSKQTSNTVYIYRLANVFGKWAMPNYNSVVATFCYNISQGLPIKVNDPDASITLLYIDDVIASFLGILDDFKRCHYKGSDANFIEINPSYRITVGNLANQIMAFKASRDSLVTENVGRGLVRALYSTYISYLKPAQFVYSLPKHSDERGVFVEILKTHEAGQFSFFTAYPGVTRGGHYHHTKTEKFLILKGKAKFRFQHMQTGEIYEFITSEKQVEIVETVPGWGHDITNIGDQEMVVMLWVNEIFNEEMPDTFSMEL